MSRKVTWKIGCGPDAPPPGRGLAGIVRHYIQRHRRRRLDELAWYREAPDLAEAIRRAAMAEREDGKCESHQRRVGRVVLRRFAERVLRCREQIGRAKDFDALHETVSGCGIDGIGALAVYDTAVRIGAYRGLSPRCVYLHTGALVGARRLGLDVRDGVVEPRELPREFRLLEPDEAEDCLCIYKDWFGRVGGRS